MSSTAADGRRRTHSRLPSFRAAAYLRRSAGTVRFGPVGWHRLATTAGTSADASEPRRDRSLRHGKRTPATSGGPSMARTSYRSTTSSVDARRNDGDLDVTVADNPRELRF